jgi:integrase
MESADVARSAIDELPSLPSSVTTTEGAVFDSRLSAWPIQSLYRGKLLVEFGEFVGLSDAFVRKLKLIFIYYLQNKSSAHFGNIFLHFRLFARSELSVSERKCDRVTLANIISYRSKLDEKTEWQLGLIRILLTDMEKLGYGACSDEALRFLRDTTIKGTVKGTSIRTRDSEKGAFSDSELQSIQSKLNGAYAAGRVDLPTYAMGWLFIAYGARPIQMAALKEGDLIIGQDAAGARYYALRIPRAKQQGQKVRSSFKLRYCSKQLGRLLEKLIVYNHGLNLDPDIPVEERPMFVSRTRGNLPGLCFHMHSTELGGRLSTTLSQITGLKSNAKRFRITLAQRAVDDGKDKYTVADLLDHSDTQNVGVYFEASPAMVTRLDRHLAMELAPLAQAFAGVLVSSEAEARGAGDPMRRIYDKTLRNNVDRPLGTCGQMSFCGLNAPFACYTCRHFQPWFVAPHEEFLAMLIEDRNRMVDEGYSPKIYNIKNRTILAIAEVIQLCAVANASSEGGEA